MLGVKSNLRAFTAPDLQGERQACIRQKIRDSMVPKTNPITAWSNCGLQADNNSAIMKSFVGHSPSFNDFSQHQLSTRQLLPSPHLWDAQPPVLLSPAQICLAFHVQEAQRGVGQAVLQVGWMSGPSQSNKQGCRRRAELAAWGLALGMETGSRANRRWLRDRLESHQRSLHSNSGSAIHHVCGWTSSLIYISSVLKAQLSNIFKISEILAVGGVL